VENVKCKIHRKLFEKLFESPSILTFADFNSIVKDRLQMLQMRTIPFSWNRKRFTRRDRVWRCTSGVPEEKISLQIFALQNPPSSSIVRSTGRSFVIPIDVFDRAYVKTYLCIFILFGICGVHVLKIGWSAIRGSRCRVRLKLSLTVTYDIDVLGTGKQILLGKEGGVALDGEQNPNLHSSRWQSDKQADLSNEVTK